MTGKTIGYYEQAHFKCNDLTVYYNFQEVSEEIKKMDHCHHIQKLKCSKAKVFTSEACINERRCELYQLKDKLFFDVGIDGKVLTLLDKVLRNNLLVSEEIAKGTFGK